MVGKQLGEGGYATVWRVIEREPDGKTRQLAVKRIVYNPADEDAVAAVRFSCSPQLCPRPKIKGPFPTRGRSKAVTGSILFKFASGRRADDDALAAVR